MKVGASFLLARFQHSLFTGVFGLGPAEHPKNTNFVLEAFAQRLIAAPVFTTFMRRCLAGVHTCRDGGMWHVWKLRRQSRSICFCLKIGSIVFGDTNRDECEPLDEAADWLDTDRRSRYWRFEVQRATLLVGRTRCAAA